MHPLVGDLTAPGLGLGRRGPRTADHVIHLGAVYDMTASEEVSRAANVEGTRSVIALATKLGATLHHVSSVAVAGEHRGRFTESDFGRGQSFGSPYHQTKFEAEQLVRGTCTGPWRVYRPSVVVGDPVTGEMDKVDGPYYFFNALRRLGELAPGMAALPVVVPDLGVTNIVPVDYVAEALVHLVHRAEGDGRALHLVHPRPQSVREAYGAFAAAAGAPTPVFTVPAPWLAGPPRSSSPRRVRSRSCSRAAPTSWTRRSRRCAPRAGSPSTTPATSPIPTPSPPWSRRSSPPTTTWTCW